jgi:hypothetical protein
MHFASHALHYFNCGHLLHILVDRVEPRMEDQAEQVQWVFRDPQASSYKDSNNFLGSRQAPVHLTTFVEFCLSFYLIYDSWMCIRL